MSGSLYLWLNLLSIAGPLARSFEPRVNFRSRWFALLPSIGLVALLFILWDAVFTHLGVWGFNPRYLIGVFAFGLPLEEWLFFVTVPYACLFSYDCLNYFFPMAKDSRWPRMLAWGLAVSAALGCALFHDRSYTAIACALAATCMGAAAWARPVYLGPFLRAYLICLVPFFIVNGILTGSVTEQPIVWYDDRENMGVRVATIPIEDAYYLLTLLWLNVAFYESFQQRRARRLHAQLPQHTGSMQPPYPPSNNAA